MDAAEISNAFNVGSAAVTQHVDTVGELLDGLNSTGNEISHVVELPSTLQQEESTQVKISQVFDLPGTLQQVNSTGNEISKVSDLPSTSQQAKSTKDEISQVVRDKTRDSSQDPEVQGTFQELNPSHDETPCTPRSEEKLLLFGKNLTTALAQQRATPDSTPVKRKKGGRYDPVAKKLKKLTVVERLVSGTDNQPETRNNPQSRGRKNKRPLMGQRPINVMFKSTSNTEPGPLDEQESIPDRAVSNSGGRKQR